ncbi:MAG: OmpA family protein [Rhodobacteraceae bacterium]|nr:OmpA family protein [Paracoccaceae bacterium]
MTILKTPLILATTGMLALTACTDVAVDTGDPYTRTREGALIGGITGAVAGIATGDNARERRRRAVIGGVAGAAVGAAVGNQLDKQAAELRQEIGDDRVSIINTGEELIVRMPQDILFAFDSASVRPDLQDDLRALSRNLQRYPDTTVDVIGHTDNVGSAAYNQDLSARRAGAVASVLINSGVAPYRVRSYGRGESQPIASNLSDSGRAQNRRVEIIIRPTS